MNDLNARATHFISDNCGVMTNNNTASSQRAGLRSREALRWLLFIRLEEAEQQHRDRIELFLICFYGDTASSQWQILQRK